MGELDDLQGFYRAGREAGRLVATPAGRLEFERTRRLLRAALPSAPADVLDVGGATGVYARWLIEAGYRVHLVDLVPEHVETALAEVPGLTAEVGDARKLPRADASADVVLLLGPLYHLVERSDRIRALEEARRVLRPGGLLVAAVISRYAQLLGLAVTGRLSPESLERIRGGLRTGCNDPQVGFTTAYFHHPGEAVVEAAEAGFTEVELRAVEGPLSAAVEALDAGADAERLLRDALTVADEVDADPALFAASAHLLVLGRAPVPDGD